MAKSDAKKYPPQKPPSAALAALMAWILPGMGHWWIGHRARGAIFLVVTSVTFWAGVAVGGVRSTVTPQENGAWIAAQLCMGPQALVALYLNKQFLAESDQEAYKAAWPASNIAVVYAGVAGLLNLLIIIDVLSRVDARQVKTGARPPPKRGQR